ncbi:MAG: SAVED domain-containing protein [Weeksellaceae bacterium]|nr:SAVED domain-containing protein [Weeksellaceae bacterium]
MSKKNTEKEKVQKESDNLRNLPEKIKYLLWGKAAGRCQFRGCNEMLYRDLTTQSEFNQAYIAHIYGVKPNSARYVKHKSESLVKDISNLMLMCDTHHRQIDQHEKDKYSAEILIQMKKEHEERIEILADISPSLKSEIVIYKASIGVNPVVMTYDSLKEYLVPRYYPARHTATDLSLSNSTSVDSRKSFWDLQIENLNDQFRDQILTKLRKSELPHISLFALAPIPLLIKLGVMLNDIQQIDVRQKRRNPDTWNFEEDIDTVYNLEIASEVKTNIALKIELSDSITDDRITSALGEDTSIYSIKIEHPDNDFVKSRKQIADFGEKMKEAFREIKRLHGQEAILNIFPAVPVSLAVQLGRVWMPKADLSMKIYDQNFALGGFVETIEIQHYL